MSLASLYGRLEHAIRVNSPTLLTAAGVTGVATTAYLVGKASFEAARIIDREENNGGTHGEWQGRLKERAGWTWKLYIPAAASGAVTVGCIISANRIGARKVAAAQAAFALSERAYSEYRDKVVEHIGEGKEQKLRDELAQDRIDRATSPDSNAIVLGETGIPCLEGLTGRYFICEQEKLKKAQNELNVKLLGHGYAYLDDFYYLLDIEPTTLSKELGWSSDRLMELEFYSALKDGTPVLVFDYNYTKYL